MKTLSTYESPDVSTPGSDDVTPEEQAWYADQDEAIAASLQPRTVHLPGREPLDLEAISDLWLD
jgi:hypothetical protein